MDQIVQETRQNMQKVLELVKSDLSTIRTGRAAPSLVEHIVISAYGGSAKLKILELATIAAQDNQTLVITPYDQSTLQDIEKGIEMANIGVNPSVDSNLIRITIPPLSNERRQELIHLMKQKLENGKIMIRQSRHESMEKIKNDDSNSEDEVMRLEKEIQAVTDKFILEAEGLGKQKEQELLQI